jgi:NAD(P)-dependent dehydrogenase (short-subunit alcohol dehydrogenase family)
MSWGNGSGLEGKSVLVTGAARGIGRAVAEGFASAGARVCATDLNGAGIDELVASLPDSDLHLAVQCDIADLATHEGLLGRVTQEFGGLDVLAHVAGVAKRQLLESVTEADWDLQTDVNLKAGFFLNRSVADVMRAQGRGGSIINFTSQGWWTGGFGGSVVYCAGKGGVVSYSRGLARTYGGDRIRVNTVAPGLIDTPMLRTDLTQEALDALIAQVPLGYLGEPADVAGVVVFLGSDLARYISGATINVSGAFLMY